MTVCPPVGKLSKKVGIPLCLFFVMATIGIWFIPFTPVGVSFLDFVYTNMFVKMLATLGGFLGMLGTVAWMWEKD